MQEENHASYLANHTGLSAVLAGEEQRKARENEQRW